MELLDSALKIWQVIFILCSGIVALTLMYSRFSNLLVQHEKRISDVEGMASLNTKLIEEMTEIRIHLKYMRESIDELRSIKKRDKI
jgi:hypothetical protein